MIILITYLNNNIRFVSHGYNTNNDNIVILPDYPLDYFRHLYDSESGEFILV